MLLTARDPHWLYARWDLTREQQKKYNALSADRHLVLRIFIDEIKGARFRRSTCIRNPTIGSCHVPDAGAKYVAQLGYYEAGGKWTGISASAATLTPPDAMSDDTTRSSPRFRSKCPSRSCSNWRARGARKHTARGGPPQFARSGHQVYRNTRPNGRRNRNCALASIISMDRVRRVWMGSLEITELIRRRLQQEMSSLACAQFSLPTSPIGGISSFSSVSSPFGAAGTA